jgi:hypothetical protein
VIALALYVSMYRNLAKMQLSIEGQALPDVRESTEKDRAAMERLLKSAFGNWLAKPWRGID